MIKSWNRDIDFFINLRVLRSFNLVNKNKLKNIFKKYTKHEFLWKEIEKMFNSGFINISNDLIYESRYYLRDSPLSSFLLNLYMSEFDDFFQSLVSKYSLRRNFYIHKNDFNRMISFYKDALKRFSPIKLEDNIYYLGTIQKLVSRKYECDFCCIIYLLNRI